MSNFKEGILRSASAAIIFGSTLGSACANPGPINPSETRPAIQSAIEATWSALPPLERLKRLELKDFPKTEETNLNREISLATAQFYCEQTKCNGSPEQMTTSVSFLDENEFIVQIQKEIGRILTDEEVKNYKEKELAFTAHKKDAIYVNQTQLEKIIQNVSNSQPEIIKQLNNKDLTTVIKKSVLMHEFTHMNLPPQTKTFSAFSLHLPGYDQPINFDQLNQFTISGKSQDGKKVFYIEGADEAVTERGSQIIAIKSGTYLELVQEYSSGASFVNQLNTRSGIANNEFLKYLNGQLPREELIKKWGKGDFKKGVIVLAAIGLNVQGITSPKETQGFIDSTLKSS